MAAIAGAAGAGSFQVNPIRIDLGPAKRSDVINVHNDGDEPVVVQVEVLGWTQADGEDVYAPSSALLATPPIMTIAPGAEHVVRVGLRQPNAAALESAYRVYVREVPPPPKEGFRGLQVALRVGVPVFIAPQGAPAAAKPQWFAALERNGDIRITLRNDGNAHIRVSSFAAYAADAKQDAEPGAAYATLSYVLGGQSRSWTLTPAAGAHFGQRIRLKAATDAGNADTELELQHP